MSINLTITEGNLTRDPELRFHGNAALLSISMANNEKFKKKDGEWGENTVFIGVDWWGDKAKDMAERLKKGMSIVVYGKLDQSDWIDKKSGQKRSKISIKATDIRVIEVFRNAEKPAYTPERKPTATYIDEQQGDDDDNIPF